MVGGNRSDGKFGGANRDDDGVFNGGTPFPVEGDGVKISGLPAGAGMDGEFGTPPALGCEIQAGWLGCEQQPAPASASNPIPKQKHNCSFIGASPGSVSSPTGVYVGECGQRKTARAHVKD